MNLIKSDRRNCEDEKLQIKNLDSIFGNINKLSSTGINKKFLCGGNILNKEELEFFIDVLYEGKHICNITDKVPDIDCESYDNNWYFPMTLKCQNINGGSQTMSFDDIVCTMKQAPKIDSIDKVCLIVYASGDFYVKNRKKFRCAKLLYPNLDDNFSLVDILNILKDDLKIKCKILHDNNFPIEKSSLYDFCIKGVYE